MSMRKVSSPASELRLGRRKFEIRPVDGESPSFRSAKFSAALWHKIHDKQEPEKNPIKEPPEEQDFNEIKCKNDIPWTFAGSSRSYKSSPMSTLPCHLICSSHTSLRTKKLERIEPPTLVMKLFACSWFHHVIVNESLICTICSLTYMKM
jgi:hypothetical protein